MSYTYRMVFWNLLLAVSPRTVDHALTSGMWWFVVLWLGCFGGCIGSFLNVVWDRMGTGEGIVLPRSRCPECDHPLRWYHNLPIIGWLMLQGRCYDCGAPISIKHPLVEAFFAAVFIAIGLCSPLLRR
jgi:prepilin signal peptidase PulO-like enzyme (type II secretory pathway)